MGFHLAFDDGAEVLVKAGDHVKRGSPIANVACMGYFSSDRSIADYARDIWHVERLDVK